MEQNTLAKLLVAIGCDAGIPQRRLKIEIYSTKSRSTTQLALQCADTHGEGKPATGSNLFAWPKARPCELSQVVQFSGAPPKNTALRCKSFRQMTDFMKKLSELWKCGAIIRLVEFAPAFTF